jgi:hypothetical protein
VIQKASRLKRKFKRKFEENFKKNQKNLKEEKCCRAARWVAHNLSFDRPVTVEVALTMQAAVGGLLSIHDLTKEPIFLQKASLLTVRMMKAFDKGGDATPSILFLVKEASHNAGGPASSCSVNLEALLMQAKSNFTARINPPVCLRLAC